MQTIILFFLVICHTLADYTHLSTDWMLSAKKLGKPLAPIFVHASIHAMLMSLVIAFIIGFTNTWAYLVLFEWISHFIIDTLKGRMNGWFPTLKNPANKYHWIIFGIDQMLHLFVIIIISDIIIHT